MGKSVKGAAPVFLLMAAVPIIPVLALQAAPSPPSPDCTRPQCRAIAHGTQASRVPTPGPQLAGAAPCCARTPQLRRLPAVARATPPTLVETQEGA